MIDATAGGGDLDGFRAEIQWEPSTTPARKPHEIWQHLLAHGSADQSRRLSEDPGLVPNAPQLTLATALDGTKGCSLSLEQLNRHRAMWLPEHDVYLTLDEDPVDFASHLASLRGDRVLNQVRIAPEATLAEWTNRWEDIGNPVEWNRPWETSWLGTRGHLTGTVAQHGSLYKFGIDRWANVRPDHASPHKFRFDILWTNATWISQRTQDGLPVLQTRLQRRGQSLEIEQFAAPFLGGAPLRRGEVPSVLLTRLRLSSTTNQEPYKVAFRLATQSTHRHPELRGGPGRHIVADRESGHAWLVIEADNSFGVTATESAADSKDPCLEFSCVGTARKDFTNSIVLKLLSPTLPTNALSQLDEVDFARARANTLAYWREWLATGAQFGVPEPTVNHLFQANLWHALMLPRHRTDEHGAPRIDLPYSNFAYGQLNADWPINQAVYVDYMIYGLRGHYDVAEEELAAMFLSQQKTDGRVGGYAEWGVYSPGMLYAIAQNFLLSRDHASFERLLPASIKALDWCLKEVQRGQSLENARGLVVAPLNDLTHDARAWAFPNAYFVAGLDRFGRALAQHGHPRAQEINAAALQLRQDVERAFARASVRSPAIQLADGTWNNFVPCDALTPRRLLDQWYPTDVDCGPAHLARLAAIDPHGWLSSAILHDHEDNLYLHQWGMANEPVYNQQATAYLRRDEPEAAIRAFYSMMACAFSHHQLTPLEHRWAWGQYYMPPSTDGAWFELYRHLILNELQNDDTLFIGQATPRPWLAHGQAITVTGAPTYFGPVDLRIDSASGSGRIQATLEFKEKRRPRLLRLRLRHPQKQLLRSVEVNGKAWHQFDPSREWITLPEPSTNRYQVIARY